MLIIFDLDDTLLDTSLVTTKTLLIEIWRDLCLGGWLAGKEEELLLLLDMDAKALKGAQALKAFCDHFQLPQECLVASLNKLYAPLMAHIPVQPVPFAIEALQQLHVEHVLAIVSVGEREQQLAKMKKAGMDSLFFYKILCVSEGEKKCAYEELLQEQQGIRTLVCGDRVITDLVPAKELGCMTVHMRRGRGLCEQGDLASVDRSVTHMQELVSIVSNM